MTLELPIPARVAPPLASTPKTSALLELPFDQYQRYRLVADLVGPLVAQRGRLRALEVGGRTGLLRDFLPQARVELVDVEPSDRHGLVLGDGSRLPFRDGAFDLVAACDTLEHVPPDRRDDFLRECCRVSSGWVVLAGPYDSPEVRGAEASLSIFLRDKLRTTHRYLEEHRTLGLPDRARTAAILAEHTSAVVTVGRGSLVRWLALLSASMYLESDPHLRGLARAYYRFYNRSLYASDHTEPVYRHALIACHSGSPLAGAGRAEPREAAPARALEPFQWLLEEMVAFDRRREIYEEEGSALRETIATLSLDLEGHRQTVAETGELLGAERAEREHLTELFPAAQQEFARQLGLQRAESATLEALLRTELEARVAHQAELERRLDEINVLAGQVNDALRRAQLENAGLRAECRSRTRSLLRVWNPHKHLG